MRLLSKALMGVALSAAAAGAQTTVSGTTFGCFGASCNPAGSSTAAYAAPGGGNIAFAGMSFTGMTNPATGGFTVSNFGTFQVTGMPMTPENFSTPFTLLFQILNPVGSTSPSTMLTISGNLGIDPQTRDVRYTGGSTTFTYPNGSGTIMTDGGFIGSNNAATIQGRITASSVVPEPSTYALMGTGLAGLFGATMRRRRSA